MEGSRPTSAHAGHTPAPGSKAGSVVGSVAGSKAASLVGSRPSSATTKQENLSEIEVIGRDDNTRPAILPEPSPDEVSCSLVQPVGFHVLWDRDEVLANLMLMEVTQAS